LRIRCLGPALKRCHWCTCAAQATTRASDQGWHKWPGDLTIKRTYEMLYENTTALAEGLDQEAVSIMAELWTHGRLSRREIEPIKDLLIRRPPYPFSAPSGGGPDTVALWLALVLACRWSRAFSTAARAQAIPSPLR
jgi:hypothetical protein